MTKKSTVSFTDRHHAYAARKVEEGVFASVSSMVAAGIERIMQDEAERGAALEAMREVIRARAALPREDWMPIEDGDAMFERVRDRLRSKRMP